MMELPWAIVHKETMASITYRIVVKAIPPCAHLFNDFPF